MQNDEEGNHGKLRKILQYSLCPYFLLLEDTCKKIIRNPRTNEGGFIHLVFVPFVLPNATYNELCSWSFVDIFVAEIVMFSWYQLVLLQHIYAYHCHFTYMNKLYYIHSKMIANICIGEKLVEFTCYFNCFLFEFHLP